MLTTQLRELEADGLIDRKVYPQVPPKVEYSMAPLGQSLLPVLAALKDWGDGHLELFFNHKPAGQTSAGSEKVGSPRRIG
jgi:DNA-binding HxlR family transcriptional regulator